MITTTNVDGVFIHHEPGPAQLAAYTAIREAGQQLARAILANTVTCADQQAALRHVREAVFTANAAVALDGLV